MGIGTDVMSARYTKGFSLIEILVVLVIIGLLASTVVLTMPDRNNLLREQVYRFAARVNMASQEGIVANRPMGLAISHSGYAFFRYQDGQWQDLANDRVFGGEKWNAANSISIERDQESLARRAASEDALAHPAILFEPTGQSTPFVISFSNTGEQYSVIGNSRGEALVKTHGDS